MTKKIDCSWVTSLTRPMTDQEREERLRKMLAVPCQLERQTKRVLGSLTPREREVLEKRMGVPATDT